MTRLNHDIYHVAPAQVNTLAAKCVNDTVQSTETQRLQKPGRSLTESTASIPVTHQLTAVYLYIDVVLAGLDGVDVGLQDGAFTRSC